MQLHVNGGKIEEINIFSDAMEQEVIIGFKDALKGCPYAAAEMIRAIDNISVPDGVASHGQYFF